ncbi:MAG: isoleucine--tRNA ligase, partial [Rhodospirillaceae bacterium]|nr:isoleucine--tRNA ligase [Rhodospirillaceae bacterium]
TIWVKFPVGPVSGKPSENVTELLGASVVVWTTTPWTIPANRAIAYSKSIDYGLYEVVAAPEDNWAKPGEKLILADALAEAVMGQAKVDKFKRLRSVDPDNIQRCAHPFRNITGGAGYWDYDVPMLPADYVSDEAGTGFVHTAPGHGADDYNTFVQNRDVFAEVGLTEVPHTVGEAGEYFDWIPLLAGKRIYTDKGKDGDANAAVIDLLVQTGALVARGRLKHSYPHSWRSKAPLIFRNTPQWFIAMGDDPTGNRGAEGLRAIALKAIDATRFVPDTGKARLRGMIETRPDWVISRQRAWGVPIAVFVHKADGEVLIDPNVNARIFEVFRDEGADAWFEPGAAARFLGDAYDPEDWEKVDDILDVWFESGSTHAFVLEQRADLQWPASLYLEGTDQHRGWFHSSLLESCGTRGRAPFEAVLTHGFILDEKAQKMSKSSGTALSPQDVIKQFGADILRLWVVGTDYTKDPVFGPETLKQMADIYRRLRNTLRYLLGGVAGFETSERIGYEAMPELERWMLHRVQEFDTALRDACDGFEFHALFAKLHTFCAVDLSAFYFDIRKDALYCDAPESDKRRAVRTVLDILFDHLTAWLAPFTCYTAEEAWLARIEDGADPSGRAESVHLRTFPEAPAEWRDDALAAKWRAVRDLRRVVTGALERERAEKRIGSSLQAWPVIYAPEEYAAAVEGLDLAELCITSAVDLRFEPVPEGAFTLPDVEGVGVVPGLADGERCERCWKVLPSVGRVERHDDLCDRCADAVERLGPIPAEA